MSYSPSSPVMAVDDDDVNRPSDLVSSPCERQKFCPVECEKDEVPETKTTSKENPSRPRKHINCWVRRYYERVIPSEGFDVPTDYSSCESETEDDDTYFSPIQRFKGCIEKGSQMWELAEFAVREHNNKTNSNLKLCRIVKVTSQFRCGVLYFFTLEAGDDHKTYLAKAYVSWPKKKQELRSFEAA